MGIQYKKTDELEKMLESFASFPDFDGDGKPKEKKEKSADKK